MSRSADGVVSREAEEGGDDDRNQVVKRRGGGAPRIAVRTLGRSDPLRIQGQNLACLRASSSDVIRRLATIAGRGGWLGH